MYPSPALMGKSPILGALKNFFNSGTVASHLWTLTVAPSVAFACIAPTRLFAV
jgi:hypothetical protein